MSPFARSHAAESQRAAAPKTLVGSNIYGWGQYAQRDKKQLDVEEVISALRDAGYDYLETNMNVAQPEENGKFAEQLKAKGLQPVSLYTGARVHEAAKAEEAVARILAAAKVCRQSGFQVISCNADPIGREKTDEELKTQAAALSELGEGLNALGMKLGVHHHMPEMASHAREFHYTFDHTKPGVVGFCYDVHWVWKGGVMPMDALHSMVTGSSPGTCAKAATAYGGKTSIPGTWTTPQWRSMPRRTTCRGASPSSWPSKAAPRSLASWWRTTAGAGNMSAASLRASDP